MTHRSAAFFALGRGALGGLGSDGPAPFELAAVQGLELSLELLLFQLRLFALPPLLVQFLGKFLQLIFIVAFSASDLLIAMKDPACGQPFQIRAPIPIGATKVVGQVLELRHGQSGGGSWSRRQLASESRWRSLRILR